MEWIKVLKVWLMRESEWMFEVSTSGSTSGSNTGMETFMPLVDGVVDKALLNTSPHINQMALQIVQILDLCLVNSLLHNAPDLVVDRIKVCAIRRPQIWRDECRCVTGDWWCHVPCVSGHCPAEKWRIRQKNDEWQATTVDKAGRYDSKHRQSWLQDQQTLTAWHPTLTPSLNDWRSIVYE